MGWTAAMVFLPVLPVPIFLFTADVGFVNLDNSHQLLEFGVFHRRPQPMAHVPSCLVRATANLALNLKRAYALFGVEDLPEYLEPSLERIFGILENCAADDAETVVLAGFAEPMEGSRFQGIYFVIAATRTADHAIPPAMLQYKLLAGFICGESFHQLTERHHAS